MSEIGSGCETTTEPWRAATPDTRLVGLCSWTTTAGRLDPEYAESEAPYADRVVDPFAAGVLQVGARAGEDALRFTAACFVLRVGAGGLGAGSELGEEVARHGRARRQARLPAGIGRAGGGANTDGKAAARRADLGLRNVGGGSIRSIRTGVITSGCAAPRARRDHGQNQADARPTPHRGTPLRRKRNSPSMASELTPISARPGHLTWQPQPESPESPEET